MTAAGGPAAADGLRLLELGRIVTGTLDLQVVLDESFVALRQLIAFEGGAIQLVDDGHLVAAATDPPAAPEALTVRIPVGQGVSGRIAATGEPIYIPDITVDERVHPEGRKRGLSGGVRSYFGAPLIEHGTPIGVLQVDSLRIDAFDGGARDLVLAFLPTITAAVQNARLFAREQETVERLKELEVLKRDFLAVVSHELRTPTVTIIGFADVLRDGGASGEEARMLAERIGGSARHLRSLIEDLLDVSGIERGDLQLEVVSTAVEPLLTDAVAQRRDDARVELVVVGPLPAVLVDPARLTQVVGNLLANALRFSGPDTQVTVRAQPVAAGVEVAVADRGEGIPAELHERVFDRFYQVDQGPTRLRGGIGVGLFLARQLCDRMGVGLRLESQEGEGSTFTLTLPAAPASET